MSLVKLILSGGINNIAGRRTHGLISGATVHFNSGSFRDEEDIGRQYNRSIHLRHEATIFTSVGSSYAISKENHKACCGLPFMLSSLGLVHKTDLRSPLISLPVTSKTFSTGAQSGTSHGNHQTNNDEASQQQASRSETEDEQPSPSVGPPSKDVHYEGPLSKTHKLLKMISISNTAIACTAAPFILEYADISYVSRVGLAASLVIFGVLTTGALHWITNPYVHELKFTAKTQQIDVRTTTLFGRQKWNSFDLADVRPLPWSRPVATFVANNRFYYIDVFSFPDEDLLKRLTPDDVPAGYKEDDDD